MKRAGVVILILLSGIVVNAQSIKGTTMDPVDGVVLKGVTMALLDAKDSSNIISVSSNDKGEFIFSSLAIGKPYVLKGTAVGFEAFIRAITLKDSMPDLDLGDLYIPKKTTTLEGVVIVASAPPVSQKADTTQFSASQFKTNPDATVEDLIKKMPGITVDKNGTVTGHGEQVKKVTVDGKDFFGDDATMAIRNLPADVVDKIQLYDRLSDQAQLTGFDDGNSVKAINIVTKGGMRDAQFGKIFGGLGTRNTYNAGGNINIFNGNRRISILGNFNNINAKNFSDQDLLGVMGGGGRGGGGGINLNQPAGINKVNTFGINYNDKLGKKVNFSASYFFNNAHNESTTSSVMQTPLSADSTLYTYTNSRSSSNNNNHRLNMRVEYQIDSSNSIFVIPSIGFQNYNGNSSSITQALYNSGDSATYQNGSSTTHRNGYNIGNNLMYRHSFAKRGRTISVSLQTTYNENQGYNYNNQYTHQYTLDSISNTNRYVDNPSRGSNINGRLSYTEPIGKNGMLEFEYTTGIQKNHADRETFDYDSTSGTYTRPVTGLFNTFDNRVITNNGGVNYRLGKGRDNQFFVGVTVQNSKLESERIYPVAGTLSQSFTTVLPNLRWMKKIGKYTNIRLFYRANTNFPGISQLQDIVDSTNKLYITSGNPNLKQSYANTGSFRLVNTNSKTGKSFVANIFFQAASNYITQSTVFNPKTGVTFSKPINMNGYKSFNSFFTYSMPVKFIKSNLNLNAGYSYGNTPAEYNHNFGKTVTNNYNGGIGISSNISEYVDFNIGYNINYYNAVSNLNRAGTNNKTSYINQVPSLQLNLLSKSGWFIQTDLSSQVYTGLADGYNKQFWLWNGSAGKKFLKKRQAELKLSAFDILKQNQSISRTVSANNSITDTNTQVLQQYFMLTFTYKLKNIGKGKPSYNNDDRRREWREHGGGMGGGGFRGGGFGGGF